MGKRNVWVLFISLLFFGASPSQEKESRFVTFTIVPSDVKLYWKDGEGQPLRNFQNLKLYVESKKQTLRFAMNGGMYKPDNSPQGLYIENGKTLTPLDTLSGSGNFYLKPNGVFYLTRDSAATICTTEKFIASDRVMFATQSGPMLVIDGLIHPAFKKGSVNVNIRNGVGILPDHKLLFAMSKEKVNFYDFAEFFESKGCVNALYLDGFVSRTYLPEENWEQLDGSFGVMIGVTK